MHVETAEFDNMANINA